MDNDIIRVFDNPEFGHLRVTTDEDGAPWFVANDVCGALEINHTATRRLDEDEKGLRLMQTPGGPQQVLCVNESGLYNLALRSRRPEANSYRRWVTHDVLPSIRRTGGYMVSVVGETPEQTLARAVLIANDTIDRQRSEIETLRPKALFADAVAASDGTCLVGELAKMLRQNGVDVGQNRLFGWLRRDGYLGNVGSNRNVPTQRAMDMGLFRIKETAVTHADGRVTINRTPKVTGKGQRYFVERYSRREVATDAG